MALDKNAVHYFALVCRSKIEPILKIQEYVESLEGVKVETLRTDDKRLLIVHEKAGLV